MKDLILYFTACLLAYLIGSIPVGYLLAKSRGVDIRSVGSGNIGATNISRSLGTKQALLVGVLDFCKGFIPTFVAQYLLTSNSQILSVALMPVIGHIFPVWLGFKGGKGVATTFGVAAAFFGIGIFTVFLLVWFIAVKLIKLMSLVNLVAGIFLPVAFLIRFTEWIFTLFGVVLCVIIWWTHRENIKRLLRGEEHQVSLQLLPDARIIA